MDDQSLILRVRFYRTDSGREPVRDWLLGLEREARKTIGEDVKTVQFGWPLGMPLIRKIEAGLWEVRSTLNHGIARVLFTVTGSDMILLNGFVKKSQKAPQSEMALARKRLAEVRRASGDHDNE